MIIAFNIEEFMQISMKETYSTTTNEISELDNKIEIASTKIQELEELNEQNMDISAAGEIDCSSVLDILLF